MQSTKEFARQIVRALVADASLQFWMDEDLRFAVGFNTISKKDQDMIFNELQVAALGYVELFFYEMAKGNNKGYDDIVYLNTAELLRDEFIALLEDARVEGYALGLWQELIDRRAGEYRKFYEQVMKESGNWDSFQGGDKLLRPVWSRVFTLSVISLRRIRMSEEAKLDDPLWLLLRRWLIDIEVEVTKVVQETNPRQLKVLN